MGASSVQLTLHKTFWQEWGWALISHGRFNGKDGNIIPFWEGDDVILVKSMLLGKSLQLGGWSYKQDLVCVCVCVCVCVLCVMIIMLINHSELYVLVARCAANSGSEYQWIVIPDCHFTCCFHARMSYGNRQSSCHFECLMPPELQ